MLVRPLTISPQPASEPCRRQYPDVVVVVTPIGAGKFEVRQAGRRLIPASRTPFCDAARALIAEGWPPGVVLAMRYRGEAVFALRGKLGAVARLTIEDGSNGRPRVRRWKAPASASDRAPVRFFPLSATTPRPRRKRYGRRSAIPAADRRVAP